MSLNGTVMNIDELLDDIVNSSNTWSEFVERFGDETYNAKLLNECMEDVLKELNQLSAKFKGN